MPDITNAVTDETKIGLVLSSTRNVAKLKAAGYATVGDLKDGSISEFQELSIGDVTLEQIRDVLGDHLKPQAAESTVIEECDEDIHIISPSPGFSLQIVPGDIDRGSSGRGMRPIQPVYLVCERGRGRFTRRMWFLHLHGRGNMSAVEAAERDGDSWRVAAYEWLHARKSHGTNFRIMSD